MKSAPKKFKFTEWFSAEELHETSKIWLSELEFLKDEGIFLENLVSTYTLELIDSKYFIKTSQLMSDFRDIEKQNEVLINAVKKHKRELKIMVDGIDQIPEERIYLDIHHELILSMNRHNKNARILKIELYSLVQNILKENKNKKLT